MTPDLTVADPIPHWPGRLVPLADGQQVYVRSTPGHGTPGHGQPAVLLHGLEGSSRNWTDLMDLLRPWLACDALDLPGFGDSPPRPDGRYSIAALAQTVVAYVERAGRGPVHLIANSLGGAVAVKLTATRPDLVKTLTLISPALPDRHPRRDLVSFPVLSLPWFGPRLLRRMRALPAELRVANVIATCFSDPGLFHRDRFAAEVAELARRDARDYPPAVLAGIARTLVAEFFRRGPAAAWREAAGITVPALVIYGSDDRVVDARAAGRAAHSFGRGARVVVLPRTGHLAHMEHPHLVAAEIGVLLGPEAGPETGPATGPETGSETAGARGRAREFPLASAG
jgi:pimeloyl-ACP methyl ester carboxylesterase